MLCRFISSIVKEQKSKLVQLGMQMWAVVFHVKQKQCIVE